MNKLYATLAFAVAISPTAFAESYNYTPGDTKRSDERQAAVEILQRVREELCEIRKMIQ